MYPIWLVCGTRYNTSWLYSFSVLSLRQPAPLKQQQYDILLSESGGAFYILHLMNLTLIFPSSELDSILICCGFHWKWSSQQTKSNPELSLKRTRLRSEQFITKINGELNFNETVYNSFCSCINSSSVSTDECQHRWANHYTKKLIPHSRHMVECSIKRKQ